MGNQQASKAVPKTEIEEWRAKYGLNAGQANKTFKAFREQKEKSGSISKDKFVKILTEQTAADTEFAEAIFASFDKDGSGSIDIHEYMALMGVSLGANIDEKLRASFNLFDEDGNGTLDKEEVEKMMSMVMRSVLRRSLPAGSPVDLTAEHIAEVKKIVNDIFDKVDTDGNGSLDFQEFRTGFSEHPDICAFFRQF
eukprot:TRINITY_DN8587_c0_g1_i1.p1 TRINITY_DN8587_c0_g1~~TRINITY_DN8587_c0_g1_i1.p1  ORF type:complete len:225 (-),score=56.43 TRINITY_DN8587_c0_g1_i1:59-646(-)